MNHTLPFEFTDAPETNGDDHVAEVPSGLASKQSLLEALDDGLELPDYFGFNWDALDECVRDFDWIESRRIVLRHADLPAIPSDELRIYLEILADAVKSWGSDDQHSLTVVFPTAVQGHVLRLMTRDG
jgi:hypothetical protein